VNAIIREKTKELDGDLPGLFEVRAALHDRVEKIRAGAIAEGCLVLDEKAIEYCGTLCKEALAVVGDSSKSVVACRARKDQKASMLRLIKDSVPESCCLAIGDGANDVAMIQAGQIGVGIIGKEGMQAVNVSDFAIGQFRFLRGLLLVHGRACYRRIATFMYFTFYKGTIFSVVLWLFSMEAMASAGLVYLNIFNMLYYFAFSLFPILIVSIGDFDMPKERVGHMPELYTTGITRTNFSMKGFWLWNFEALLASAISTYVPIWGLHGALGGEAAGSSAGAYWILSWASMHITTWGVNLRLVFEIASWDVLTYTAFWGTLASFSIVSVMFSYWWLPQFLSSYLWTEYYGMMPYTYATSQYWLVCVLGVFLYQLPRAIGKSYVVLFRPLSAAKKARIQLGLEEATSKTRGAGKGTSTAPLDAPPLARTLTSKKSSKELSRASRMIAATAPTQQQMDDFRANQLSEASSSHTVGTRGGSAGGSVLSPAAHHGAGAVVGGKMASTPSRGFAFSENAATSKLLFERTVSGLNKHAAGHRSSARNSARKSSAVSTVSESLSTGPANVVREASDAISAHTAKAINSLSAGLSGAASSLTGAASSITNLFTPRGSAANASAPSSARLPSAPEPLGIAAASNASSDGAIEVPAEAEGHDEGHDDIPSATPSPGALGTPKWK